MSEDETHFVGIEEKDGTTEIKGPLNPADARLESAKAVAGGKKAIVTKAGKVGEAILKIAVQQVNADKFLHKKNEKK